MRAFLIVLDSVGIGAAPDADDYGDAGANTLAHTADVCGGLELPVMQAMGLGGIPGMLPGGLPIRGVPAADPPAGSFGAMREMSRGKDTTTGHWEMAGLLLEEGFRVFPAGPPAFPAELVARFEQQTGRPVIGNLAASGTHIIAELGPRQMREGGWIVYTSADSVFQVAAHEDVIPLEELYRGCQTARRLCDAYRVGRVIARPYIGQPGAFVRTDNRRDYSFPLPENTILDELKAHGHHVVTIGKLDDVFAHRGISESIHHENSADAQAATIEAADRLDAGFVFTNLIDFDMRYGHRRDPAGYGQALESADRFLGDLRGRLKHGDLLIVTADHGNDPTFRGTDHTREFVPLLVHHAPTPPHALGIRQGFYDVARTLADFFAIPPTPRGVSFLGACRTCRAEAARQARQPPSGSASRNGIL